VDCSPDVGELVHVAELEWNLVRPISELVLQRHHRCKARENKNRLPITMKIMAFCMKKNEE